MNCIEQSHHKYKYMLVAYTCMNKTKYINIADELEQLLYRMEEGRQ